MDEIILIEKLPVERVGDKYIYKGRFRCFCGKEFIAARGNIKSGHTKSCGCRKIASSRNLLTTHGQTETRLYRIWCNMKTRCNNPKAINYKRYGAKNIKVCSEWENNFQAFYAWSHNNGYQEHLTIDRIKGELGYFPSNCRWIPDQMQGANKMATKRSKSGFKGVFPSSSGKWLAQIRVNRKLIHLGTFDDIHEAATAYNKAALKYFGEFSRLNSLP